MGEAVFWLKSLYQLGFVCVFDFYFWIRVIKLLAINRKNKFELFLSNLLSLSFKAYTVGVKKITNTILAKAFDQPINEVIDILKAEQHTIELANINIDVNKLLDKTTTLKLIPSATRSNVPKLNVNQIYFEEEVGIEIEQMTNPYLQEAYMVLEAKVL
ncbi:hypothetical protein BAZOLSSOX_2423 [uncultured Gammaproteobacteria bacterium]|jgi:hypothetical protein|nr:hypothetical protein [uncultured Gammaproteobacteria bacterium]VVH55795.1 hypothetical protein BAZOLSSOX_2423 [uncultured Gammaproteobacteria bacterium]